MNDEDRRADRWRPQLGKTDGAGDPSLVGPEPEAGALEDSGTRLEEQARHRLRRRCHHPGGPEVTWTQTPTKAGNLFFKNLFENEWS